MRVRVLYFGMLKDLLECEREEVELPDGSAAEALIHRVAVRGQAAAAISKTLAVAVNREYARASAVLHDGDEVALLPPVSGGCLAPVGVNDAR